jgi:uncharacterized protein (DUF58 family)
MRRAVPEGIRITKVGLWFVLLTLVVAIAATNTGNNALYMVLAVMLGALVLSGVASRENVRRMDVALEAPGEIFANRAFTLDFTLESRSRFLPRWFLLFSVSRGGQPLLVPYLPRRGRSVGKVEMLLPTRGRHSFPYAHVSSLFPFGFFTKGVRYPVQLEMMVFPEIFPAAAGPQQGTYPQGDDTSRRSGWGHDLHALRVFRRGDDPRAIHWKQTARTGQLIYMEREAERSRRLAILFDNAVGKLDDPALLARFERLVSEAATSALDHLARGYDVELVTRDVTLAFAGGPRQRLRILEALAIIAPIAATAAASSAAGAKRNPPLVSSDARAPELRIHMEPERIAS